MNLADSQHLLLDLLSTQRPVRQASLDALSPSDWIRIRDMAREHRLLPMLHWRLTHEHADLVVEPSLRAELQDANRKATLRALRLQRELGGIVRILASVGIPCLALKGAYLAFAVYPQPALRPMRDLDVLVDPAQAPAAYAALREAGFTPGHDVQGDVATCIAEEKHLPLLVAPGGGVNVELHVRLTPKRDGQAHGLEAAGLWERQVRREVAGQQIAYLSPTDLLLHLIYHAAYDHRLNNGPLTLCDLAGLIGTNAIDWPRFWDRARDSGWLRGSLLLLRMTQRYFGDLAIPYDDIAADELEAASRFADEGATLTLCSHDKLYVSLATSMAGQSLPRKMLLVARRFFPTPTALALQDADTRTSRMGLLRANGRKIHRMLTVRLPLLLSQLRRSSSRRDIRREVHQAAELGRWLA